MNTLSLTVDEIFELAKKTLLSNRCDEETATILADLIMKAERDGSLSHGYLDCQLTYQDLKVEKLMVKQDLMLKKSQVV